MPSPKKPRQQPTSPSNVNTTTPRRSLSQPLQAAHNDDEDTDEPLADTRTPVTNHDTSINFRASAPPVANPRFTIRTPGSHARNFRSSRQLQSASAKRQYAVPTQFTPHGRAAIRALDLRRAAMKDINTPGRNRRRSMRDQRETPRDVLRMLSKTLATKSKRISTSSSSSPDDPSNNTSRRGRGTNGRSRSQSRGRRAGVVIPEDADDSDEFPIDRPRFSLPIDEDADSDDDLPRPPRSSGLEDLEDNYTMQSIEMPRRQTLGQGSRYSIRMSDYGSLNDPQSDNDDGGDAFFPRLNWDNDVIEDDTGAGGEDDATIERLDDEAARRDTIGGRISDFGAIDFDLEAADQSTVVLAPQVQSSPARPGMSSPVREKLLSPDREGSSPVNEPFEPFAFDDGGPLPAGDNMDVGDGDALPSIPDITVDEDEEVGDADTSNETVIRHPVKSNEQTRKPGKRISRYGIQYPALPTSVVKRLAQRFAGKSKISPDTLNAILQASDWFFEQLGDDLQAYAHHANRGTINESDMLTLLRRQRQTSAVVTPFALAQRHLSRELLQGLKMPAPVPLKGKRRRKQAQSEPEGDE